MHELLSIKELFLLACFPVANMLALHFAALYYISDLESFTIRRFRFFREKKNSAYGIILALVFNSVFIIFILLFHGFHGFHGFHSVIFTLFSFKLRCFPMLEAMPNLEKIEHDG